MAHKLSLHLDRTLHTSLFKIPKLISPFPSPTHSNHRFPLHFPAASLLINATVLSSQCFTTTRHHRFKFVTTRVVQNHDVTNESEDGDKISESSEQDDKKELAEQSIWVQMKEIALFTGPATGLWLCGPLMSLIDTAVVGQGSSIELAALGILL